MRSITLGLILSISTAAHADETQKTVSTAAFVGGGVLVAAGVITTMAAFGSAHCDLTMQPCSKKGAETGAAVGITLMAVGVLAIAAIGIPFAIMDKKSQTSLVVSPGGVLATF